MLDAVKIPGGPSGEEWYAAPASVPKAIGDLKQIDAQSARRSVTQPAATDHVMVEIPEPIEKDTARRDVPQPDASELKNEAGAGVTASAIGRHATTELD